MDQEVKCIGPMGDGWHVWAGWSGAQKRTRMSVLVGGYGAVRFEDAGGETHLLKIGWGDWVEKSGGGGWRSAGGMSYD